MITIFTERIFAVEDQDKEVQRRHAAGESYEEIAKDLNLDVVVVQYLGDAKVYDAVQRALNSDPIKNSRRKRPEKTPS